MKKIKDILKNAIVIDILTNLIYAILVILYFWALNTQGSLLEPEMLTTYIHISSLVFLAIGIIMFELGYKNDKAILFIYGIEFIVLAIFTLLIKHLPKVLGYTMKTYTEIGVYSFLGYYILKSVIQYTIKKHNELKNLSDIKEIIKEEPIKKATKRKNIKVEEGK